MVLQKVTTEDAVGDTGISMNGSDFRSRTAKTVGLFMTSMKGSYYEMLADAVCQGCRANGYELNIVISDKTDYIMSSILGKQVDGVIIFNPHITEKDVELLAEKGIPTVFLDREKQGKRMSSVVLDSCREGELAARYLLELGHTTFAYLCGVSGNFDNTERLRGFRNALAKAGFSLPEDSIWKGEFDRDIAYEAVKNYLDTGKPLPEAVFAANDLSAIGAIEALTEEGIRVPEQVSSVPCRSKNVLTVVTDGVKYCAISMSSQPMTLVRHLMSLVNGEESIGVEVPGAAGREENLPGSICARRRARNVLIVKNIKRHFCSMFCI